MQAGGPGSNGPPEGGHGVPDGRAWHGSEDPNRPSRTDARPTLPSLGDALAATPQGAYATQTHLEPGVNLPPIPWDRQPRARDSFPPVNPLRPFDIPELTTDAPPRATSAASLNSAPSVPASSFEGSASPSRAWGAQLPPSSGIGSGPIPIPSGSSSMLGQPSGAPGAVGSAGSDASGGSQFIPNRFTRPRPWVHGATITARNDDGMQGKQRVVDGVASREYPCVEPGCGKSFTRPSKLRQHIRSHTGERPFHCDYPGCLQSFTTSSNLKRHVRKHGASGSGTGSGSGSATNSGGAESGTGGGDDGRPLSASASYPSPSSAYASHSQSRGMPTVMQPYASTSQYPPPPQQQQPPPHQPQSGYAQPPPPPHHQPQHYQHQQMHPHPQHPQQPSLPHPHQHTALPPHPQHSHQHQPQVQVQDPTQQMHYNHVQHQHRYHQDPPPPPVGDGGGQGYPVQGQAAGMTSMPSQQYSHHYHQPPPPPGPPR